MVSDSANRIRDFLKSTIQFKGKDLSTKLRHSQPWMHCTFQCEKQVSCKFVVYEIIVTAKFIFISNQNFKNL